MTGASDLDNLGKMGCEITKLLDLWEAKFSCLFHKYQGVMVGASGGLDSTTLIHLLWQFAKRKKNFNLGLIHINYGLRGEESNEDQAFVEALANRLGLSCKTLIAEKNLGGAEEAEGVQLWARNIRRQYFQRFSDQGYLIALAHHQDDIAENALFRISRGSGVGSLAGMQEHVHPYWRPLLKVAKQELAQYAEKQGILYRQDSSNDKIIYSRNLIRHKIIPELENLFPGASERIAQTAMEAQEIASFAREKLAEELAGYGDKVPAHFVTTKPQGLAYAAIGLLLSQIGRPGKQYSRQLFSLIWEKLQENSGKKRWRFNVTGGLIFYFDSGFIGVEKLDDKPHLPQDPSRDIHLDL